MRPRWRPHPEHAAHVRTMYRLKDEGYRTMEIVEHLNSRNIPSPKGGLWTTGTVRSILKNKTYLGYASIGKTSRSKFPRHRRNRQFIENPNTHPPLVSEELYQRVQERIKESTKRSGHSPNSLTSPNPLSERIKCGRCGANMVCINQGDKKKLICATKKNSGISQCSQENHELYPTLEIITSELCERIITKDTIAAQVEILRNESSEQVAEEKKTPEEHRKQVA